MHSESDQEECFCCAQYSVQNLKVAPRSLWFLYLDCFKCQPDFIWILPHAASDDLAFISLTFFPREFLLRRDFLRRAGKVKCLLSKQSYFFICQRRLLQRVPSEASLTSKITNKVFFWYIFFCLLRYLLGFVKQREESVHLLNHTVPSKATNGSTFELNRYRL